MKFRIVIFFVLLILTSSCKDDVLPKPAVIAAKEAEMAENVKRVLSEIPLGIFVG